MLENPYNQPEKKEARRLALYHAVESLTDYRDSSPVVTLDHFERGVTYWCDRLEDYFPDPHEQVKEKSKAFVELHASRVGKRQAHELQVLFLCGPEPMNDLKVMFDLGLKPENIWAVESDKQDFDTAVESLSDNGCGIKIYKGGLEQFFEIVPQQFDIIYFDACGSLPSSKPSTIDVLRLLFERQRLAHLGVLITNFCQANQDGQSLELWAKRLGSWFFGRDEWKNSKKDYPESASGDCDQMVRDALARIDKSDYLKDAADNLGEYYSQFVTRFVIEFGGLLMPWWRVAALDGTRREYYSPAFRDGIDLKPFHAERQRLESTMDAAYRQDSRPVYRRVLEFVEEHLPTKDPLRRLFCDDALGKVKLSDAVWLAYALRNCGYVSHCDGRMSSMISESNRRMCSEDAVHLLSFSRWVDRNDWEDPHPAIFANTPTPHLLSDLLLGLYGYPYHCNVSKQRRWCYTAEGRKTPMYLDVFVLDQARYFYDLIPTLPLLFDWLRFPEQCVLRVCMDGIFRHTNEACSEWFSNCALAGEDEPGFEFHYLPDREIIKAPDLADEP